MSSDNDPGGDAPRELSADAHERVVLLRDHLDALAWMCGDFDQECMSSLHWAHWRGVFEGLHLQAKEAAQLLE